MKFYKDSDYAELVKDLLELIPIRVYAFLDFHLGNTNEHLSDWIIGLRKYIMIDLGFVKNQKDTPELINIAYSWMEKKLTDLVKETDKKANFQFHKPVKDWTKEEFERNKKQILDAKSNPFRDNVINSLIQLFESKQAEYLEYQNNKIKNEWHFDPNKPLKNYEEVFRRYESYLNLIDWDIEGLKHFKAFTRDFEGFEQSVEMYIPNVIHRAKQEINQQVFTQNNNSERIINNTKNKINSIIKSLEKNSKENNLSNADMILKYRFYLDAVQPFWDFSDWFRKEILGESLTETESPAKEKAKSDLEPNAKKIHAKFYAFYHWILIKLGKETAFEKNEGEFFPKNRIEKFANEKYPETSSQRFYQEFRSMDITAETAIAKYLGKGYKETIIKLSNSNADVIAYLKDLPNK